MTPAMPDRRTRQIRVTEDLADMLGWIAELDGRTVADVVDPLIRPQVAARYDRIRSRVEIIKAAKANPDKKADDPMFANELTPDLGGES